MAPVQLPDCTLIGQSTFNATGPNLVGEPTRTVLTNYCCHRRPRDHARLPSRPVRIVIPWVSQLETTASGFLSTSCSHCPSCRCHFRRQRHAIPSDLPRCSHLANPSAPTLYPAPVLGRGEPGFSGVRPGLVPGAKGGCLPESPVENAGRPPEDMRGISAWSATVACSAAALSCA